MELRVCKVELRACAIPPPQLLLFLEGLNARGLYYNMYENVF